MRVEFWQGESLLSILSRSAERNFHDRVLPLLAGVEHGRRNATALRSDPAVAGALSALLGVPTDEIVARQYPRLPGPAVLFRGERLQHAMVMGATRRVSPESLRRARYHRAIWDLTALDVCPETGDRLLDHCPACGKRLGWIGSAVHECHACGFDLRRAPGHFVPEEALDGVRFVADLLEPARGAQGAARSALAPEFAGASAGDLVSALILLGRVARTSEGAGAPAELRSRTTLWKYGGRHADLSAGLPLLADRGGGFGPLLDRLRDAQGSRHPSAGASMAGHFGPAFRALWLLCLRDADSFVHGVLKTAVRRYFEARADIPLSAKLAEGLGLPRGDGPMTAADVRREFGLQAKALGKLAAAFPEVVARPANGRRSPALFSRPSLARLTGGAAEFLTRASLAAGYGIGPRTERALAAAGALNPVPGTPSGVVPGAGRRAPSGGRGGAALFSRREVEALVGRLCAGLPIAARTERGLADLRAVVSRCRKRGARDKASVFAAILSGELAPCALREGGLGLRRLLFDAAGVTAFCDARFGPAPGRALPVSKAARAVGWHASTMGWMVRHGLIAGRVVGRGARPTVTVPEAELRRAALEYVTPSDLAREHGVTRVLVGRRLRAAGVAPAVNGKECDQRWGAVYRRADLAKLDLAGLFEEPSLRASRPGPGGPPGGEADGRFRARAASRGGEPVRGGVTDQEWTALAGHLPRRPGRALDSGRLAVDGMIHVIMSGQAWRRLPPRHGSGANLYARFRDWSAAGVWDRARLRTLESGGPASLVELLEAFAAAGASPRWARRPAPERAAAAAPGPANNNDVAARAAGRTGAKSRRGDAPTRPSGPVARSGTRCRRPPVGAPADSSSGNPFNPPEAST